MILMHNFVWLCEHEIPYQNAQHRVNADMFQLAHERFSVALHIHVAVHIWNLNLSYLLMDLGKSCAKLENASVNFHEWIIHIEDIKN